MRRTSSLSRRTSAPECGTTLAELVVTIALLLVVSGTLLGAWSSMQRSEAFVSGRAATLDEMRITMNGLTKDVRQAYNVTSATADRLEIDTYRLGEPVHVVYAASGTSLTRDDDHAGPFEIQPGLSSTTVFEYLPSSASPEVVTITLSVVPPDEPETVVTVTSEVRLRNRGSA